MSCDEYEEDLIDAAAGAAASSLLEAHLVDCPRCRNRLDLETAILAGFDVALRARLEAKPSAAIQKRITARVAAGTAATWSVRRAGVVAAGIGAVLVAGWAVGRPLRVPGPASAPGTGLPSAAKVAAKKANALAVEVPTPSVTVPRVARSVSRPAQELAATHGEP